MAALYLVHWDKKEIKALIKALTAEGHEVRGQWNPDRFEKWGDYRPDIVIISLERLPSHGRSIAEWILEAKSRRNIPIIFAGGKPDKVKAARQKFPNANFVPLPRLLSKINELLKT